MKIAYVLDDLDAAGGIQAVTRAKAAALAARIFSIIIMYSLNKRTCTPAGLRRICRRASGW